MSLLKKTLTVGVLALFIVSSGYMLLSLYEVSKSDTLRTGFACLNEGEVPRFFTHDGRHLSESEIRSYCDEKGYETPLNSYTYTTITHGPDGWQKDVEHHILTPVGGDSR
jgi:hypothetical protein